ncbi:hypothetical protein [Nonomuraea bangladeshensis]|uniref:hypothetical protein n=1 Tax=Nonomuraea bangladeshensis TaxID=404385 RepID=UPI003C2C0246
MLIVNLGAPIRSRAGTDIETAGYADGRVVTVIQTILDTFSSFLYRPMPGLPVSSLRAA